MLFSDVWSEDAALFKRLMKIHSNPPILLYYGFKFLCSGAQVYILLMFFIPLSNKAE